MNRIFLLVILFGLFPANTASAQQPQSPADAAPLTAEAIMARVAANQDRAETLRKEYVYQQHLRIVSRRTNGKLEREEISDYRMIPTPQGTEKKLEQIKGQYRHKDAYIEFKGEPVPESDSLDAGLIRDFRDDLVEGKSKDGLGIKLFPLTTEEQKRYRFHLMGEETFQGRRAYRLGFGPADKDDLDWAGEAYVDAADFQPIYVFTKLSRRIPLAIRTMLGTDLPGIGFSVRYERQSDGVWFPKSLGSEFRLHVVFFLNRDISISLDNSKFEHTHVETSIAAD